jgi:C1A family cysteine protease
MTTLLTPRKVAKYGWRPDLPDARDLLFEPPTTRKTLPASVSLRDKLPQSFDQGALGSCTGNAIAGAVLFAELASLNGGAAVHPPETPSRLFIYYGERVIEGDVGEDNGAQIRDGIKVVAKEGAPPESLWPYDIKQFAAEPPKAAFSEALKHRATEYRRVPRDRIRDALAAGFPVVFGFTVYESFETREVEETGVLNLPEPGESVVGGHAVLAVGYDDATQRYTVRNSWGPDWGDHGHFTMPYAYLDNRGLSSDFWTVTKDPA